MLVLTRKQKETIKIGDNITITILRLKGQMVRVGIEAPRDVRVVRGELGPEEASTPETSELPSEATPANSATAPQLLDEDFPSQVMQFRFSPQPPATLDSLNRREQTGGRGPLSSFLTSLHTPGVIAEPAHG